MGFILYVFWKATQNPRAVAYLNGSCLQLIGYGAASNMEYFLSITVTTLATAFVALLMLRPLSTRLGFVDIPNARTVHHGHVPNIGGLSVYLGMLAPVLFMDVDWQYQGLYILGVSIMVLTGALDDLKELSAKSRLLVQAAVSLLMLVLAQYPVSYLGEFPILGTFNIGGLGYVVGVFAIIGSINAFNMIDGIDGLAGSVALIALAQICLLLFIRGNTDLCLLALIVIVALIPYLILNLGLWPFERKVFMGDAGVMFVGFTIAWLLINATQSPSRYISPISAFWIISLPFMDILEVIRTRLKQGKSPFQADRQHIHHLFLNAGLPAKQALVAVLILATSTSGLGLVLELTGAKEWIMVLLFIILNAAYFRVKPHLWKLFKRWAVHPYPHDH